MKDGSYRAYDEPHVAHDNSLSLDDVKMANKIQGRMGPLVVQAITQVAADVEPLLAQIGDIEVCRSLTLSALQTILTFSRCFARTHLTLDSIG